MKFIIILFSALLASCVSTGPRDLSCEGTNWYELGRQAGRQGQNLKNQWDLKKICGTDRDLYSQKYAILETGYYSGLAEFCSPENAFNLGRLNLPAKGDCPDQFQSRYQEAFQKGKRYAMVEKSNLQTDQKINDLTYELGTAGLSLAKRALREGQRLELVDEKRQQLSELKTLQEFAKSSQGNQ